MAVTDLWRGRDGRPTARDGRGLRWRATVPGHPSRAFATKTEARAWEAELLRRGRRLESDALVSDLVSTWLDGKAGLSERGLTACRGDAAHVLARWGGLWASEVRAHEVQAWIAGLEVERGPRASRVRRPASEALRRRLLQCLSGALRQAIPDVLESNPCDGVRVPRQHRREGRFLTVEQVRALATATGHYAPLVWLLATTGVRIGEAAAATVGDVDTRRGRLRVARAKGLRGRDVPVPAKVLGMLDLGRAPSEPLVTAPGGGRVHPDTFRARHWQRAVGELGLAGLRIHDLRHTAISLAIESGADVKVAQRMAGHRSATLTLDTYGHLLDSRLDDVSSRMDEML